MFLLLLSTIIVQITSNFCCFVSFSAFLCCCNVKEKFGFRPYSLIIKSPINVKERHCTKPTNRFSGAQTNTQDLTAKADCGLPCFQIPTTHNLKCPSYPPAPYIGFVLWRGDVSNFGCGFVVHHLLPADRTQVRLYHLPSSKEHHSTAVMG